MKLSPLLPVLIRTIRNCLLGISAGLACGFASSARADLVVYKTRNNAVAAAKANGKLILLISGTKDCTFCAAMKSKVLTEGTPERFIIDQAYEFWDCPQDEGCTSHRDYASGGYTLPLSCLIDPYYPLDYLDRRFGNVTDLPGWLKLGMLRGSAPVASNLASNQSVFSPDFTVQGQAKWPSLFVNWTVNQAGVWCRLNGNAWTRGTVSGKTNWSFTFNPAHLRPGSNVFQAYFRDSDYNRSQTNTISFSYVTGARVAISSPATLGGQRVVAIAMTGGVSGSACTLWMTTNLLRGVTAIWTPIQTRPAGAGGAAVFNLTNPPPRAFFRATSP